MALFGKTDPPSPSPSTHAVPRPDPPAPRGDSRPAVIGPKVRIQGELAGEEDVVVEGRVDGRITVTKGLRIGPAGQVNAEISAQHVAIAGRVVGNVTAVDRVELLPSGYLEGNIRAPKIVIAEGAQFKGSVDMGGKASPTPIPALADAPAAR